MFCAENINITIIGGSRGLGKWIAQELHKDNFNVTITSRNRASGQKIANKMNVGYDNDNINAVKNANIIIFSVPIEHMIQTIKEVAPYAPGGSLLMDVTSVKTEPAEALKKYAPDNAYILPCHPMFSPRIPSIEGQVVILTPVEDRSDKYFEGIEEYLSNKDANVVVSTPQEHDKTMSVVQGLTHFSYIAIASTIKKLEVSVKKSRQFASPVYSLMLDMISRIVSQNPYLYYSIQKSNKETSISRKTLIEESNRLAKLIDEDKEDEFVNNMSDSAKHLDEYEEALGRSDKAISILTHDFNTIKSSKGKEMGFKHQYSKNIHVGIVESVTTATVTINDLKNDKVTLNISNITIMSDKEVYDWKINNLPLHNFDVSVIFPKTCDTNILIDMFRQIKPVINVQIKDIYTGRQIEDNFMSITFHYSTFKKSDKDFVEKYLAGIGGKIR